MAHFRGHLRTERRADLAAPRNRRAVPRGTIRRQFRVRRNRQFHAATRNASRTGKSSSKDAKRTHRSASSIFGISTRRSMTKPCPAIWTRCSISRRRSRPTSPQCQAADRSRDARGPARRARPAAQRRRTSRRPSDCCASFQTSTRSFPAAASIFHFDLPPPTWHCSGANCSANPRSAKSPSAAKPATSSASIAGSLRASNRLIRRCRCASNPASAGISTRFASRRSRCRNADRAKC